MYSKLYPETQQKIKEWAEAQEFDLEANIVQQIISEAFSMQQIGMTLIRLGKTRNIYEKSK